jgi:hypothetical protein
VTAIRTVPRWAVGAYALLLTLAVTAPLLAGGYLLLRDAVSTPRSYLSDSALGLGDSAPRAVPQDFAIAVVSTVIDGGVVVKATLIAALFLAGWGAARLADRVLPEAGLAGQFVAATVAVWNPDVAERLLQGHWSLLLAYGCLPWVAAAVRQVRAGPADRRSWAAVVGRLSLLRPCSGARPIRIRCSLVRRRTLGGPEELLSEFHWRRSIGGGPPSRLLSDARELGFEVQITRVGGGRP